MSISICNTGALFLVNVFFFASLPSSIAQEACSRPIGSNISLEFSASGTNRFYLNTAKRASCNGTISKIDYCYYGPPRIKKNTDGYQATMALYRLSDGGISYNKVSDTVNISKLRIASSEETIILVGFNCDSYLLSENVQVQEGDVIGACIYDPGFRSEPLVLVGESASNGYLMMYQDTSSAGCSSSALPDIVTDLILDNVPKVLHISAQITPYPSETQTVSSMSSPTTSTVCTQSTDGMCSSVTETPLPTSATTLSVYSSTVQRMSNGDTIATKASETKSRITEPYKTVVNYKTSQNLAVTSSITAIAIETPTQGTQNPVIQKQGSSGLEYVGGILGGLFVVVLVTILVLAATIIVRKRGKNARQSSKPFLVNARFDLQSIEVSGTLKQPEGQTIGNIGLDDYDYVQDQYATTDSHPATATNGTDEEEHIYHILEGPQSPYSELLEKNNTKDIYEEVTLFHEPAEDEDDLYTQIKSFGIKNINKSSIQIRGHLGSGQFGSVKRGFWKLGRIEFAVALKALSEGSTAASRVKFLQEAAIMAQFRHSNIVSLYGVISKDEPMMLVVELAEKGDLSNYLTSLHPSSNNMMEVSGSRLPNTLLTFSQQVALGMYYLSSKGFVHRDLAARNILVSKDNICKIADFGMSRDLADQNYYVSRGGEVPVKWTAPEAIHYKKYSTASDVWSYGCLLYEIWSLGHMPFEDIDALEVIKKVENGLRLAPPPGCSRTIYELMIQCWHPKTSGRPKFRDIFLKLTDRDENVLSLPGGIPTTNVLGSSLEYGEHLYKDLQEKYLLSS